MHFSRFFSAPSDPGPPRYRCITITLRHTTLIWTSDKADAEASTGKDATLTRDKHTNPREGFEAAIPASERAQTHALAQPLGSVFCRHIALQVNQLVYIFYMQHTLSDSLTVFEANTSYFNAVISYLENQWADFYQEPFLSAPYI